MKRHICLGLILILAGCGGTPPKQDVVIDQINAELKQAARERPAQIQPEAVSNALLPPLRMAPSRGTETISEPRFNLVVNNAPAGQVFMGIVSGTRYSMLMPPDLSGTISVNLKDVTVLEALHAIRELYGYEYKVDGTRIYIQSLALQTKVFRVNYLTGQRRGESDIRVTATSITGSSTGTGTTTAPAGTTTAPGTGARGPESSKITTSTRSDFWDDLEDTLRTMIGCKLPDRGDSLAATSRGRGVEGCDGGRSVIVNPQSGVVVVRAIPVELRNVAMYLQATQLSVEKQVILEAKILEVELDDTYQAGINWAGIANWNRSSLISGTASGASGLTANSGATTSAQLSTDGGSALGTFASASPLLTLGKGVFGIAFAAHNFAALIEFLQTQGKVQVLSSPRIATLNNQKAVLKVGTDEFFVTNVSTTTTTGTATTTTPSVTLQPFFSGIALDVTPQIDENNNIILHIHPSVSKVSTVTKKLDLGTSGILNLPLASSNVSETDSIIRAQDGQIVAIGGLMKLSLNDDRSQVPGAGDAPVVGSLFRQTKQSSVKKELVILLKPTVIEGDSNWVQDIMDSQQRIQKLDRGSSHDADKK